MPIRLTSAFPFLSLEPRPFVPVVRISGAIGMRSPLSPPRGTSEIARALDRAFAVRKAPAVVLLVNSPGGSPVQSHMLHRRVRALAEEKETPVIAVVEDLAASGGYMVACAADEIIADPASVVGSIGVVSAGFGFADLLDRLGVERRVHTAGNRKAMLDPFRPERPEDVAHLEQIQAEIHDHFIALVKARRGDRLSTEDDLFSGLFWSGQRARELGLVDGLGTLHDTVRARYGADMPIRLIEPARRPLLRRLVFGFGEAAALGALTAAEERMHWLRYRL